MPAETRILDSDVTNLRGAPVTPRDVADGKERHIATVFWGDTLKITGKSDGRFRFELPRREWNTKAGRYETRVYAGLLPAAAKFRAEPLLKVRFIDVGQGDGAILESPRGKLVLVDGGEEEHMRRYMNVAFSHVLKTKPIHCDAIVVSHGDADHFSGLTELLNGFRGKDSPLVTAGAVYHNGLVKGPSSKKDKDIFGKTVVRDGETYVTDLEDDLLKVPDARMNKPFLAWKAALQRTKKAGGGLDIERLEYGSDGAAAFPSLAAEGIRVDVLGPITAEVNGKPGLPFLHTPGGNSLSASHTVNGHSIVLKVTYGNVRFLFGADLNAESEESLLERARTDGISLSAEILKVPHHGSADFSPRILEAIRPVVSVVSSGDENEAKEYIHPRSGLVGALGKYSRSNVEKPLIYVTEMVAFFKRLGRLAARPAAKPKAALAEINNAYQKTAFGIVHVRTDGERVLVVTHSGKADRKESYAFRVDALGEVRFET